MSVWRSHARLLPIYHSTETVRGGLVASGPRNAFKRTARFAPYARPDFPMRCNHAGEEGRPELPLRHRHPPSRYHAVCGARAAPARSRNRLPSVLHPLASWAITRAKLGLLSKGAPEAVWTRGPRLSVPLKTNSCILSLTHFNEQEQPSVLRSRSAVAQHGLPAAPGAGVDEQRQPTA